MVYAAVKHAPHRRRDGELDAILSPRCLDDRRLAAAEGALGTRRAARERHDPAPRRASTWRPSSAYQPWVVAKLVALVAYILIGMVAITRGRTKSMRIAAWVAAQCVFLYIVAVAVRKNPLPLP